MHNVPHVTAYAVVDPATGHAYPAAQSLHTPLPATLYFPDGHCITVLFVDAAGQA